MALGGRAFAVVAAAGRAGMDSRCPALVAAAATGMGSPCRPAFLEEARGSRADTGLAARGCANAAASR